MLNLSTFVVLCTIVCTALAANRNLTSPPITNWGQWGSHQRCPNNRYAQGFQLKTEPNQLWDDDTALNAIKLFCGDPYNPDSAEIKSSEGDFGSWGKVYTCYPGVLTGFQLRVEKDLGSNGDNTATNNVRFSCSSLSDPNDYIQGDGLAWGEWGTSLHCSSSQGICGITTQVEPYQGSNDDTALNNVVMECCDMNLKEFFAQQEAEEAIKIKNGDPPLVAIVRKLQRQQILERMEKQQ